MNVLLLKAMRVCVGLLAVGAIGAGGCAATHGPGAGESASVVVSSTRTGLVRMGETTVCVAHAVRFDRLVDSRARTIRLLRAVCGQASPTLVVFGDDSAEALELASAVQSVTRAARAFRKVTGLKPPPLLVVVDCSLDHRLGWNDARLDGVWGMYVPDGSDGSARLAADGKASTARVRDRRIVALMRAAAKALPRILQDEESSEDGGASWETNGYPATPVIAFPSEARVHTAAKETYDRFTERLPLVGLLLVSVRGALIDRIARAAIDARQLWLGRAWSLSQWECCLSCREHHDDLIQAAFQRGNEDLRAIAGIQRLLLAGEPDRFNVPARRRRHKEALARGARFCGTTDSCGSCWKR